ncbi:MAG: hypothetical protein SXA11_19790 [Cyanobacteriota bacterium]|nr:hypothetical protein [Cyanobacteriota bacterium]
MAALNPHNKKIQELIEEIDTLLDSDISQSASVWKKNYQKSEKLLKRVRNVLASQSQQDLNPETAKESQRPGEYLPKAQIAEMLAELTLPWQEEIRKLQQERQELVREIRELERQRQYNYSLAQQYTKQQQIISEFTQALLGPVQERIIDCLESRSNLQERQESSNVSRKLSGPDEIEGLFPARRVHRRGEWQENIEQRNQEETSAGSQQRNLEKLPSRDGPEVPVNEEIFPYPGYEWFESVSSTTNEQEPEETIKEALEEWAFLVEEAGESLLPSTGKEEEEEEEEEEDEEEEFSELNQTFLQLDEWEPDGSFEKAGQEARGEDSNYPDEDIESKDRQETFLQLDEWEPDASFEKAGQEARGEDSNSDDEDIELEAEGLAIVAGIENGAIAPGSRDESKITSEIELEKTEAAPENVDGLSELFGELSPLEEEEEVGETQSAKSETEEEEVEETYIEKEIPTKTQETNNSSAIAKAEKEPFIAASADEDLLPTEEVLKPKDLELLVNEITIEQLETDLAQLEEANREDEADYSEEDYQWENTVIQTDSDSPELEPSFPRELVGKEEEEESENLLVLEGSSPEEEDVVSFEDFLANISDLSKQTNSSQAGEEEDISIPNEEERSLEDILASLTSIDEAPAYNEDEDDDDEKILIELLQLEDQIKDGKKTSPSSEDKN